MQFRIVLGNSLLLRGIFAIQFDFPENILTIIPKRDSILLPDFLADPATIPLRADKKTRVPRRTTKLPRPFSPVPAITDDKHCKFSNGNSIESTTTTAAVATGAVACGGRRAIGREKYGRRGREGGLLRQ
ncbi:hypothetical protein GWI33_001616 [Rhynchophorus ferrugineus]|uniref:Uncharacterized protein n=1 Tax=Rhynchophorus ferrugineus TaxID=354439 RepID=A0A834ISG3_RHYFE|nr:hypothetical protein GWI33_001616 [Rhynchophorus ferrugineus]